MFYGDTSSTSLSFPVPTGLRPATLNATLDLPFPVRPGTLSVLQDERLVTRIVLPTTDLAPVVLPLNAVEVTDNTVTLTLRLSALAEDGYCLDWENALILSNGSVTYTGTERLPTTVADFLPPILRTVTLGVPESPSQAESNAAVQLAASCRRATAVSRRASPWSHFPGSQHDCRSGTAIRTAHRRQRRRAGRVSLVAGEVPQLLISGSADQLANQIRLLTDGSLNLAVSTSVVAGDMRAPTPPAVGNVTTLTELGALSLSNVGVAPQVGLPWIRPVSATRSRDSGCTSPGHTPRSGRRRCATYGPVNGEVIDSWGTGPDTTIDHWIDIPDRLVTRYTYLVVGMDTSGNTGRCGEYRPIKLTVDGSTVVESTTASPPIPPGFGSLPQALMPRMQVGLTPGTSPTPGGRSRSWSGCSV